MLKKLRVRRGCTVPSQLTWLSTRKSDGTQVFATTGSVDGCSVLLETQFAETCLREDIMLVLSVGGSLTPEEATGERQDFDIKLSLGAPLLILSRSCALCLLRKRILPQDSGWLKLEFSIS